MKSIQKVLLPKKTLEDRRPQVAQSSICVGTSSSSEFAVSFGTVDVVPKVAQLALLVEQRAGRAQERDPRTERVAVMKHLPR